MKVTDIIELDDVNREIKAGYVSRRFHPDFPQLAILNYTDRAQFDQHWTATTTATRGIIYNTETLDLIARPFGKMFNWGDEKHTADIDPDAPTLGAFNKWDGSLGIAYQTPDGAVAIATRGSFASEQAMHATALLNSDTDAWANARGWIVDEIADGWTPLFEIIYPGNRIVLDYGDRDELALLGSVSRKTGAFSATKYSGDTTHTTIREVLALPPRKNAEGWIVWLDAWRAVKIKQDDYLALHRIVSSLTVKEVWRQLRAGTFDEFVVALPDEFHEWATKEAAALRTAFQDRHDLATAWHQNVTVRELPDRKSQALYLQAEAPAYVRGFVFGLLDGRDISDGVWRDVEPKAEAA